MKRLMKKAKWLIPTALVLALTACQSASNNVQQPSKTAESSEKVSETKVETEPTVLSVTLFDRGQTLPDGHTLTDNPVTQWVNENFGKPNNITVKYTLIPRDGEIDKLNVLMASKTAPDIILTYDRNLFFRYASSGGIANLGPSIEKYGSNLKEWISEYGKYNGELYAAMPDVDKTQPLTAQFNTLIRKDWLDKLQLPIPTTTDEFYNTLKAFKEQDPGKLGQKNVIPLALTAQSFEDEEWQQQTQHLNYSFVKKMSEEEFFTLPQLMYPGYKDGVRFLNKLYNEGLIDPDFALMNFTQMYEKVAKGQVGTWAFNVNSRLNSGGPVDTMIRSFDAEVAVIEPFKNSDGITPKRGWSPAAGLYIMVPASSKNVDAAIKYLNWMAVEENRHTITYGIKGVNWEEVDGAPVVKQDNPMIGASTDMSIFFPQWIYRDEAMEYYATMSTDKTFGHLKVETLKLNRKHVYINPIFDQPIQASTDYAPTLNGKYQEIMIKSIMAKPEQFDSVYDGLLQEYMNIGGTKVMEEKVVAYRDMVARNGNKPLTAGNPLIQY